MFFFNIFFILKCIFKKKLITVHQNNLKIYKKINLNKKIQKS